VALGLGCCALPVAVLADPAIQSALAGWAWPPAVRAASHVTWLGYGALDVGIFLALAGLHWRRGQRAGARRALLGGAVVAAAGLLSQVVKNAACRARPSASAAGTFFAQFPCLPAEHALSSFPSGHATTAFAAAVLLAIWYPRASPALLGLAGLVAASRVVLGSHFTSDVLAGALLGTGAALAALALLPSLGCEPAEGARG
jgi:membrane-associated phospholipid phosphatase